jgi:hypothetical protein
MLIQTSSPRPILNVLEHPQHIVIHTLRRIGISTGEVLMNMSINPETGLRLTAPVEPYDVFPIEGENGFEAVEYYLPFSEVFGVGRRVYSEEGSVALAPVSKPKSGLRDTQLAVLCGSGFSVIAKSAYRVMGSRYEERLFDFTLLFPITGGGILRASSSLVDISNPTFDPKAPMPQKSGYPNLDLLRAFNRTHKVMASSIEQRRAARIASAEASIASNTRALPPKSDGSE